MKEKTATEEYMDREDNSIYTTTVDKNGPVIRRGDNGPWFVDIEGKRFLDFTSQISLVNTGYNCPDVERFLISQVFTQYSGLSADWPFYNEVPGFDGFAEITRAALAEKLIKLTRNLISGKREVMFEVSGATGVNAAAYLAMITYLKKKGFWTTEKFERTFLHRNIFIPSRHDPFRFSFLAFKNAFHGRHGIAKLLTDSKAVHYWGNTSGCAVGRLTLPSTVHRSEDIIEEANDIINRLSSYAPIVGFFFEPIQGEGGINVPNERGMKLLIKYLQGRGINIIADEIQTGLGRTGKMFGCEHFGIQPDMIILSKSLGAGLPIGAVIANVDKFPDLEHGMHSGSHHCPPLACAAAIANLGVIERSLPNAEKIGNYALGRLSGIAGKFPRIIKEVRGRGLMIGVDFHSVEDRVKVIKEAKNQGLLLAPCGKSTIRICPPINITRDDLGHGLNIFEKALTTL